MDSELSSTYHIWFESTRGQDMGHLLILSAQAAHFECNWWLRRLRARSLEKAWSGAAHRLRRGRLPEIGR